MKRRTFVKGSTGLVAGMALTHSTTQAQSSIGATRIFRLAEGGTRCNVQDLLISSGIIYSLHFDIPTKVSRASATSYDGRRIWEYALPSGRYLGLGIDTGGLLVQALNADTQPKRVNSLLRLDTSGRLDFVTSLGSAQEVNRLYSAGESRFLSASADVIQVRQLISGNVATIATLKCGHDVTIPFHVDVLSSDVIALTQHDGSAMMIVDLAAAVLSENSIAVPDVVSAIAYYRGKADPSRGSYTVIPATGSDEGGMLYSMIYPSSPAAVKVIKIDRTANGSAWQTLQFPSGGRGSFGAPIKLIPQAAELGVVYADGTVAWYGV
jgi:hypothetical protein